MEAMILLATALGLDLMGVKKQCGLGLVMNLNHR